LFWKKSEKTDKSVKNLSEREIQRQLYGKYMNKVEVMDSSFLVKEKEDAPIQEKFDTKAKKELDAEIGALKSEFKRLQNEVSRLKKDKETLEGSEVWFKPPFLGSRHLAIIGSLVVLIAIALTSFFAIKFFVSKINHRQTVTTVTSSVETKPSKKENPSKISAAKKPAKKAGDKKP